MCYVCGSRASSSPLESVPNNPFKTTLVFNTQGIKGAALNSLSSRCLSSTLQANSSSASTMSTKRCGLALAFTALLASIQIIPVAADGEITCSSQPPLLPRNSEYLAACHEADFVKETAVGLWPCFRHVTGNLSGANIFPSSEDKDSKSRLVAKNADLTGKFSTAACRLSLTERLALLVKNKQKQISRRRT